MVGRSIRIFLVDGTATGTRTAELGLSTIKALVVPRASLSYATQREEPQKTGVYVLLGQDSDIPNLKRIYIGEGDTIINRISSHNKDPGKDFPDYPRPSATFDHSVSRMETLTCQEIVP